MNWSQFAKGEFTWATRKKSTLDYIIVSQKWLQLTRHLLSDEEGWFDVGSDHNFANMEVHDKETGEGGQNTEGSQAAESRQKEETTRLEM